MCAAPWCVLHLNYGSELHKMADHFLISSEDTCDAGIRSKFHAVTYGGRVHVTLQVRTALAPTRGQGQDVRAVVERTKFSGYERLK